MKMKELSELGKDELLTKRRDLRQESLHLHLPAGSRTCLSPGACRSMC